MDDNISEDNSIEASSGNNGTGYTKKSLENGKENGLPATANTNMLHFWQNFQGQIQQMVKTAIINQKDEDESKSEDSHSQKDGHGKCVNFIGCIVCEICKIFNIQIFELPHWARWQDMTHFNFVWSCYHKLSSASAIITSKHVSKCLYKMFSAATSIYFSASTNPGLWNQFFATYFQIFHLTWNNLFFHKTTS